MEKFYTVRVAVIAVADVEVTADSREEAVAKAEQCATPMHATDWAYFAEDVLEEAELA